MKLMQRIPEWWHVGFITGLLLSGQVFAADLSLTESPLFISQSQPPLTMMVMGRNHKLYYEAYNDTADLNGDGVIDVRYNPSIEYFGYFDSYKCYTYSSGNARFEPSGTTPDKTCTGQWSGDFLNYITTSRMDALRKVFYGGYRSTDTSSLTVIERSHIPQDAHSWGKEYNSELVDGYNIEDYTPLSLPPAGFRHIFANTTDLNEGASAPPKVRVLTNTSYRVWEWVSKERPVADTQCNDGSNADCTSKGPSGSGGWAIVPEEWFTSLTQSTYKVPNTGSSPNNTTDFDNMETTYANNTYLCGSQSVSQIDGDGNPFSGSNGCSDDDYFTLFTGTLVPPTTDTYEFATNGDDAVEFKIASSVVSHYYGLHGAGGPSASTSGTYPMLGGQSYNIKFRHHERGGGDSYELYYQTGSSATSSMTDYVVRVVVCDNSVGLEDNCQRYGASSYKPVGLLQNYGENDSIKFGLLTGSYMKNTSGGVLRKNVASFTDEVDPNTGVFTSTVGIVKTIDRLKTIDFGGNYSYNANCSGYFTNPLSEGNCRMWGNPIGEMMYETMRYFAGMGSPTSAYTYTDSGSSDNSLGLPLASWQDPYSAAGGNFPECSKPFQIVISDINPSYDSDQIPGSAFSSFSDALGISMNAQTLADTIWDTEIGTSGSYYIGHSIGNSGDDEDFAPTAKDVDSFGDIRGLAPEEPTKEGSYYSASVAYHGKISDLHSVEGDQNMETFAVALASPLPRIEIPVGGKTITLVPFGKSTGGCAVHGATSGLFLPSNQIVDFYVESIDATSGKFRINFEDVEYGNDHDMDAIVEYSYQTVDTTGDGSDDSVTITLNSVYAAGCVEQHMGYVISGTTADGTYLEVRDRDTSAGNDDDYFLDTPPGELPGGNWDDNAELPLTTSRTFSPGSSTAASLLKDPLWYAAKWGGFKDSNDDDKPINDSGDDTEWDEDGDGDPDNYFLVTNALGLGEQLSEAFEEILSRNGSSSSVAVNSGSLNTDTLLFQARFNAQTWTGELLAYNLDDEGFVDSVVWNAADKIETQDYDSGREVITFNGTKGVPFRWPSNYLSPTNDEISASQVAALTVAASDPDDYGQKLVNFVRGDDSNEDGVVFRDRASTVLGDIVNSDPIFVGAPYRGFPDDWGTGAPENSDPYSTFVTNNASRKSIVYVGSNDGMLHGFQGTHGVAGDGQAVLSFVPSKSFNKLQTVSSPNYRGSNHTYLVDGGIAVEDAYINSDWHTVLVGSLGAGGQGVYALDVTDPSSFSEGNADSIVLWEFTDADDADLGYTIGMAAIGRFHNGQWLAVFGNGYNATDSDGTVSADGDGVLYLVDLETGSIVDKFDTNTGMAEDPKGLSRPNGLATPSLVDIDNDLIVDYIYVGDLFGNVWKYDVTDSNKNNWETAYGSDASPDPFYSAVNSSGTAQPITVRIEVGRHPLGTSQGLMLYFGTGQYMETGDNTQLNQDTQSFYGLWDKLDGTRPSSRSVLLEQTIDFEVSLNVDTNDDGNPDENVDLRVTSDNSISWSTQLGWFMDLLDPTDSTNNRGERQVSNPLLRAGRIIFTTLEPSDDVCSYGGSGWLMELDAADGGRLSEAPFDVNNDGVFDEDDLATGGYVPSGYRTDEGIPSAPAVLARTQDDEQDEVKAISLSSGTIKSLGENSGRLNSGRQSWRQLR